MMTEEPRAKIAAVGLEKELRLEQIETDLAENYVGANYALKLARSDLRWCLTYIATLTEERDRLRKEIKSYKAIIEILSEKNQKNLSRLQRCLQRYSSMKVKS